MSVTAALGVACTAMVLLCWYISSVVTGPRVALSLTSTMHDTLSLQCMEASLVHAVAPQLHDDVDVGMSVVYCTACVSRRCLATCCGTLPSPSRAHSSTPPCCSTTTLRTLWQCGARWSGALAAATLARVDVGVAVHMQQRAVRAVSG